MSTIKERKILEGIVSGDEAIIKDFYKKNLSYIRSYILQNSGNEEDVEDVFQDALILIYQKLKSGPFEITSSVSAYFYSVCKNIWRNKLRKKRKIVLDYESLNISDEMETSILEEIENKEREQVYRKYFVKLNDTCKEVLNLVFEGKSMKEISKITGYSEGYTRKKKFECKRSLIELIEKDPVYKELKTASEEK